MAGRFLTLSEVEEVLAISARQAYALVRSGELPAIQIGGKGVWRVEAQVLEEYIEARYADNAQRVAAGDVGTTPAD